MNFEDYESKKLILGNDIIEKHLSNLSLVVESTDPPLLKVIIRLKELARTFDFDYVTSTKVGDYSAHFLKCNLWRVYPRLFKLAQSETDSSSLVKRMWEVEIPKIRERI